MDILPPEILIHVFEFLDFCSLRAASMVCRKWHASSREMSLLNKGRLVFDVNLLLEQYADDVDDGKFNQFVVVRSANVTIVNLDDDFNSSIFFRDHSNILGHHVRKLTLQNCSILEKTLIKIIQYCTHLQELDLNGCSSLFISATSFPPPSSTEAEAKLKEVLMNLQHLGISGCNYMSDSILSGMFELCRNLQSISLPLTHLQFSTRGLSRINSLTFDNLLHHLSTSKKEITQLCLNRTHITSHAIKSLCMVPNINLRKISLHNCNELTNSGVAVLVEKQRNLEFLDLSGCSEVGYDVINDICHHSHKIKILRLNRCMRIQSLSSNQLQHISNLDNLIELNLSNCHSIKIEHLKPIFTHTLLQHLNLKSCDLTYFNKMLENQLQTSEKGVGIVESLKHLNISSSKAVNDRTMLLVCAIFINLQSFDCSWCHHITDAGLLGIPTSEYNNNQQICDLSNEVIMECVEHASLNHLNNLTCLNMSSCFSLTTFGMKNLFKYGNFPQLKKLELATNKNSVNDEVIFHMANKCANIQLINIKSCHQITDTSLDCMSQHFPYLTSLDVSNCNLITKHGLMKIAARCWWLKHLESCMCGE